MFASQRFFGYPQAPEYTNYAALAEARAAEAAAKAAEAEYYAIEAARREQEAFLRAQSTFWAPSDVPAPPCFANQHPAGTCSCCNTAAPQITSGYPYTRQGASRRFDYFEPAYGFAPTHCHHHHHQHQHGRGGPVVHQPTPAEIALKAKLNEERQARIKLEQELKHKDLHLNARQHELAQAPLFGYPTMAHKEAPTKNNLDLENAFGAPRVTPHMFNSQPWPAPAPKHAKASAAPASAPRKPVSQDDSSRDHIANMVLQSLFGGEAFTQQVRPTGRPAKQHPAPQPAPKKAQEAPKQQPKRSSSEASLIDQLKYRHQKEESDEVRDTIQAIVNSLLPQEPSSSPATKPAANDTPAEKKVTHFDVLNALLSGQYATPSARPAPQPTPTSTASASATPPFSKGKAKETPAHSTNLSSKDVLNALERVERIEHTFHSLEAEFTFPAQLDFLPSASTLKTDSPASESSAIFPHLAFTARNHPVRYYEQTLSSLLQQLDLIESHGNASLRLRRKLTVRSIEQALEELEREVAGRWKASVAKSQGSEDKGAKTPAPSQNAAVEAAPEPIRIPVVDGQDSEASEASEATGSTATSTADVASQSVVEEVQQKEEAPATSEEEVQPQEEAPKNPTAPEPEVIDPVLPENNSDKSEPTPLSPSAVITVPIDVEEPSSPAVPSEDDEVKAVELTPEVVPENVPSAVESERESPREDPTPTESPAPQEPQPVSQESAEEGQSDDTFLLAQPRSPIVQRKRASVEIEDLGSDWSDLDA